MKKYNFVLIIKRLFKNMFIMLFKCIYNVYASKNDFKKYLIINGMN